MKTRDRILNDYESPMVEYERATRDTRCDSATCPKCGGSGGETIYDHDCWGKPDGSHDITCYKCNGKGYL